MVEHGLRDASKKEATERSKPSSSENDEVDIATARDRHDLPRRISVHDQPLGWISRCPEHRGRIRQHFLRVGLLLAPIVAGLPIPPAGGRRPWQDVHEADAGVAHQVEKRQEAHCRAGTLGTIDGDQRAPNWPWSTLDDCDRTGRVPCGGQRRTPDEESFETPQPTGSEREHVRSNVFRRPDDLEAWIALRNKRLDLGPSPPEELGRSFRGLARFSDHAFPELTHGLRIARWLRERRHRQHGHFEVRGRSELS